MNDSYWSCKNGYLPIADLKIEEIISSGEILKL